MMQSPHPLKKADDQLDLSIRSVHFIPIETVVCRRFPKKSMALRQETVACSDEECGISGSETVRILNYNR
ncbi:hypothetical protein GmarT_14130 [Gimesia maris]|uniref:Uncharacterized protein n=2 Tax=Gimesia maris TaxID=122 RepID=A0ABX5YIM6_9PLAN|nr:hypothetical protein GmarT_14130 [Gimesia maris]